MRRRPLRLEPASAHALPEGMQVLERGWLSSNCVLFEDDDGATLIDSGYCTHAAQTAAIVAHAIAKHRTPTLERIVNTHLHSDHCGGNALLAERFGCDIVIPEGNAHGVRHWDPRYLSFDLTGQRCDRFDYTDTLAPGDVLILGDAEWEALAAPGHDVDSLMFFCKDEAILIAGDAIWEDGCGAMFPTATARTLAEDFAAAFETLELVEAVGARLVIPGHGRPFADVTDALVRARGRLKRLSDDHGKNAIHVAKTLVKYRLLDDRRLSVETIHRMFRETPALRYANRDVPLTPEAFADRTIAGLVASGAVTHEGEWVADA